MSAKTVLEEAEDTVGGDRQTDYGDTQKSFTRIAGLWSAYLGMPLSPKDVGMMMVLLKVSRAKNSDKRDTLVDMAGYVRCTEMLKSPYESSADHPMSCECIECIECNGH